MAEYGVATISVLMPHSRLRPRAADLPRSWNTTQPSPISATHIGKRLAGKLHEPFERAGGGRAKTPPLPTLHGRSILGKCIMSLTKLFCNGIIFRLFHIGINQDIINYVRQ